jgi:uridylate kinase
MTYKRIMLKLSGESLSKAGAGQGIHQPTLYATAEHIAAVYREGVQIVIVVGGGNIWRYRDTKGTGIERTASDAMGMLATIMNSVALQAALTSFDVPTRVLSAIDVPQLAQPYIRPVAIRHLEKNRVVICAGGTGNPYFTTDSAAALRGLELHCEILLKATNVDGIYDADPRTTPTAQLLTSLTFDQAIEKNLQVLDQSAFSLCREQKLPIRVFNASQPDALLRAARGEDVGTLVHD